MSSSTNQKPQNKNVLGTLQLVALSVGLGTVAIQIGAKGSDIDYATKEIDELRDISQDLIKATLNVSSSFLVQEERLKSLWDRVESLESRQFALSSDVRAQRR